MIRVLVVRSEADLEKALTEANKLLAFEGQKAALSDADEILGIWISKTLGHDLRFSCQELAGSPQTAAQAKDELGGRLLGVYRSASLSGVWALASLDGPALWEIESAATKRKAVMDQISRSVSRDHPSLEQSSFLPVFDSELPKDTAQLELEQLQREYPCFVITRALCHDRVQGLSPC